MYKGLVIERKGNIVKSYMTCDVSLSVDGSGMAGFTFCVYDKSMFIYEKELNTWLNVDYEDIDGMMFCLIKE